MLKISNMVHNCTRAINQYGGIQNFRYKVLKTLRFNNIRDLRRLADQLITKYNSINNGYNMRYNEPLENEYINRLIKYKTMNILRHC